MSEINLMNIHNYNQIPCNIYQTWYTKNLPPKMKERVELLKNQNPKFKHYLFDDNDCREFIRTYFRDDVLDAYDRLIPGAYKADLWRYCVLFINGGIYLDIKFACDNGFKLIDLTFDTHFVKDRPPNTIYNALMACFPGNILLYKAIRQIVKNVKNKYYGTSSLHPTGPALLGQIIIRNKLNINVDMRHYDTEGIIYKNKFVINTTYPEYNYERNNLFNNINSKHYTSLWNNRQIYK
jgi:mannosyltransferase OCH1-like enzyme